jgi:hypothetical protein
LTAMQRHLFPEAVCAAAPPICGDNGSDLLVDLALHLPGSARSSARIALESVVWRLPVRSRCCRWTATTKKTYVGTEDAVEKYSRL